MPVNPESTLHHRQQGNNDRLIVAIAKAYLWLDDLKKGRVPDLQAIAKREDKSLRNIRMMINLAFLAPDIIKAALDGVLPESLNATEIAQNLPLNWTEQRRLIGIV